MAKEGSLLFPRILTRPGKTFFLFGPRGTGKSTWLKQQPFDLSIDLLRSQMRLSLERDPDHLIELTAHLPKGAWIMIDEVQKVPPILDTVHGLYENMGFKFALSGSSARKLKRAQANLLAGRALNCSMYPLVYSEYGSSISLDERVRWGTLPIVVANRDYREETLESYLDTYMRQELVEEGIVRKLEPFSRFLKIAALMNGQVLNVENIARESRVARTTVDKYFDILVDTLIGFRLPAYQPSLRLKEVSHPKFYFFDPGVVRVAADSIRQPLDKITAGFLFETFLLNEIRAYNDYLKKKKPLYYYSVSGGGDVDLIVQLRQKTPTQVDKIIAIEMKFSNEWKSEWSKDLRSLVGLPERKEAVERLIGIYTGENRLTVGSVDVFPVDLFLSELFAGNIF